MNTHTFCLWVSLQKNCEAEYRVQTVLLISSPTFLSLSGFKWHLSDLANSTLSSPSFNSDSRATCLSVSVRFLLYAGLVALLLQLFLHQTQRSYFNLFHTISNAYGKTFSKIGKIRI